MTRIHDTPPAGGDGLTQISEWLQAAPRPPMRRAFRGPTSVGGSLGSTGLRTRRPKWPCPFRWNRLVHIVAGIEVRSGPPYITGSTGSDSTGASPMLLSLASVAGVK